MRQIINALSSVLNRSSSQTTTATTDSDNTSDALIVLNDEVYTPWKCIHHALRITVQILRPFVIEKVRSLHEDCLLTQVQDKLDEASLLMIFQTFDNRFKKSTQLTKPWKRSKAKDHFLNLAQCFCGSKIMKNKLHFTSRTNILESAERDKNNNNQVNTPIELDFDASAVFGIIENCNLFEKHWTDTDIEVSKCTKAARFIRNKMMHNQDMIVDSKTAEKAINWLIRLVVNFNYELPGESPSLSKRKQIIHLKQLAETCKSENLQPENSTTEINNYNPVGPNVSTNYRRELTSQRRNRQSRSLINLRQKRSYRRFMR